MESLAKVLIFAFLFASLRDGDFAQVGKPAHERSLIVIIH